MPASHMASKKAEEAVYEPPSAVLVLILEIVGRLDAGVNGVVDVAADSPR